VNREISAAHCAFDIKLEAARLMSEALRRPKEADELIELAQSLFQVAYDMQRESYA
jgi:hypothetical protein